MRVEKIRRQHVKAVVRCHNGCQKNNSGYYTPATHRAWLVGYATPLCGSCAQEWKRIYDENLEPVKRRQKVAA